MALAVSVPLIVAVALFQTTSSQAGPVPGMKPDAVMVLVAMAGLQLPLRKALFLAFVGGAVLDIFSGMPLGLTTILMILVAGLGRLPNRDLVEMNPFVCMVVVAILTVFTYVAYIATVLSLGGGLDWLRFLTTTVLPTIVANSLISPLVFLLFKLLRRRILPVQEEWR